VGKEGLAPRFNPRIPSLPVSRRTFTYAASPARRTNERAANLVWRLQEREQRVVAVGSVLLALIILIGGILMPLQSVLSSAVKGIELGATTWPGCGECVRGPHRRQSAAGRYGEAPVVLVDRVGREAGLASALRGTQPSTTGGVRVQLEAASLTPWSHGSILGSALWSFD